MCPPGAIKGGRPIRASTHARIRAQATRDQAEVVERDGGEDVEAGAAVEQQSGDGLVVDEILQRRRPMIDVPRLQLRAVIQQEPGDFGIRGAVKRGLAVAAAGVNDIGIGAHQLFQLVQKPEARGRPWRHAGAARDQRTRLVQCQSQFENSEATGPPGGARIDVGAMAQQDVDQRQVLFPLVNGGRIEVETRLIDARADLRVPGQQLLGWFGLAGANGGIEPFDRRHRRAIRSSAPSRPRTQTRSRARSRAGRREASSHPDRRDRDGTPAPAQWLRHCRTTRPATAVSPACAASRGWAAQAAVRPRSASRRTARTIGHKSDARTGHDDTSFRKGRPMSAHRGRKRFVLTIVGSRAGGSIPFRGRGTPCRREARSNGPTLHCKAADRSARDCRAVSSGRRADGPRSLRWNAACLLRRVRAFRTFGEAR